MADLLPALDPVSAFFAAERDTLLALGEGARVLDLACGRGRHSVAAAELGLSVLSVDRNAEALNELGQFVPSGNGAIETRVIDLEGDATPALDVPHLQAVFVFRYLHRSLMPWIEDQLAPGGFLLYETFTTAQRDLGWGPSRSDFLLEPGELPTLFPRLEVEFYAEGRTDEARPAETARLRARKPA
ncbi:MAG: class I SAM-dependent methyltransferase [Myxococcota bacterium]